MSSESLALIDRARAAIADAEQLRREMAESLRRLWRTKASPVSTWRAPAISPTPAEDIDPRGWHAT